MKEFLGKANTIRELLGGAKDSPCHCQNLLARSLHPKCYENNPGFLKFIADTGLPFHPLETFRSAEMEERCDLYLNLAECIWNPERLMEVATA